MLLKYVLYFVEFNTLPFSSYKIKNTLPVDNLSTYDYYDKKESKLTIIRLVCGYFVCSINRLIFSFLGYCNFLSIASKALYINNFHKINEYDKHFCITEIVLINLILFIIVVIEINH